MSVPESGKAVAAAVQTCLQKLQIQPLSMAVSGGRLDDVFHRIAAGRENGKDMCAMTLCGGMKAVYKRELRSYFGTPLAYIFLSVFILLCGFLTFEMGSFFAVSRRILCRFSPSILGCI